MAKPLIRMYVDTPLATGEAVTLGEKLAHYAGDVMRLKAGDALLLFNGRNGEWQATITDMGKRSIALRCEVQARSQCPVPDMMVCFAPPRGGRIDSIIEKATELGARILQPVRTERSVVDKVNEEKWLSTVREAAEQCERLDLPDIRPMVTLPHLLAGWEEGRTLFYGDESGSSAFGLHGESTQETPKWAVLTGPEGGFSPAEIQQLQQHKSARGVGLGPRILRTDTAVITLCALTQAQFGDWALRPHFKGYEHS